MNKQKNILKQTKGITLIALVITVIVLLILAGVSISAITGNESAMEKAKQAKNANEAADELDTVKLAVVEAVSQSTDGLVHKTELDKALTNVGIATSTQTTEGTKTIFKVTGSKGQYKISENGSVEAITGAVFEPASIEFTDASSETKTRTITVNAIEGLTVSSVSWGSVSNSAITLTPNGNSATVTLGTANADLATNGATITATATTSDGRTHEISCPIKFTETTVDYLELSGTNVTATGTGSSATYALALAKGKSQTINVVGKGTLGSTITLDSVTCPPVENVIDTSVSGSTITASVNSAVTADTSSSLTITAGGESKTIAVNITVPVTAKVGDYVTLTADQFESTTNMATKLSALSSVQGTSTTVTGLTRDANYLTWRILEVDGEGNPTKLISAVTLNEWGVNLNGANGYNNAVYLLNGLSEALYTTTLGTTKNIKIEDLEAHFASGTNNIKTSYTNSNVTPNTVGGTKEYTRNTQYPAIAAQEAGIWLNGSETEAGSLGASSQTAPVNDGAVTTGTTSLKITQTYYGGIMSTSNYTDSAYYYLFHQSSNNYWLASRCVDANSSYCGFFVSKASSGGLNFSNIFYSTGNSFGYAYGLRPVVSLNSGVKATKTGTQSANETTWNKFTLK